MDGVSPDGKHLDLVHFGRWREGAHDGWAHTETFAE